MQATRSEGLRAPLPLPPLRASRIEFGLDDLHDLRAHVAATATAVGLPEPRVSDLVAAASELAANSVIHGGGRGLATIWGEDGAAFVEVADAGRITDPEVGTRLPDPEVEHGRGLYIANQLCDEVVIDSTESGTRVRLRVGVEPRPDSD
jgi:anti-sigma regulatory factor (Ser/Thr protein kinase)